MGGYFDLEIRDIMTVADADSEMAKIGSDPKGVAIMREKAVFRAVRAKDVPLRAANLVKQTFLSKGAEAAVSRGTAGLKAEKTDILMMATLRQYREAIASMKQQPFGLKALAEGLEKILFEAE